MAIVDLSAPMHPNVVGNVAKERFSYSLRPGLARWGKRVLTIDLAGQIGGNGRKTRQNR